MRRKRKMLALVFLLTVLPFLLLSAVFYASSVLRDQRGAMAYTLGQTASVIDAALSEVRLLADTLCVNPVVQGYMRIEGDTQRKNDQIDEMHTLENLLAHCYQNPIIHDIRLYFVHPKFYTAEQISFFPMTSFESDAQWAQATTRGQFSDVYLRSYKGKKDASVVTYYRLITDASARMRTVGALCVDIDTARLAELLRLPRGTGISTLALLRPDGSFLLSQGEARPAPDRSRISALSVSEYRDGTAAVCCVPLSQSSWLLWGRLPNAYALFGGASNALFYLVLALLMALALCIILSVSSAFASRVDQLLDLLDLQEAPALTASLRSVSSTSLPARGMLKSLNAAVIRARELLESQRRQVVIQQQTQLKLLQAQINPHFLYNALDCAHWLILSGERERASEMVLSIARYYRFALSQGRDELTVAEDLELALTYARIQECRLRGHVQIHAHVPDALRQCIIPKMTLQPVVENSIMHGFLKELTDARIDIDVYASEGWLYIVVCDNGVGMDAQLAASLPCRESATGGFGLYSVHKRCLLFSGCEHGGVSVESEKGSYTAVTIRIAQKSAPAGRLTDE